MELAGKNIGELFANYLNKVHSTKDFSSEDRVLKYDDQYITTFLCTDNSSVEIFSGLDGSRTKVNISDPNSLKLLDKALSSRIATVRGRLNEHTGE